MQTPILSSLRLLLDQMLQTHDDDPAMMIVIQRLINIVIISIELKSFWARTWTDEIVVFDDKRKKTR